MSTTLTRLSSTRPLLAVLGYAVAVVVLLAMAWNGIADTLPPLDLPAWAACAQAKCLRRVCPSLLFSSFKR